MKQAIDIPPFGELADPRVVAELAAAAEQRGWDGFFVWDHVVYREPVRAVADPWVTLAAIACATSRLRIGPMVTPLSRRRVHKLARETVTLDLLSAGRLILGVGLGSARNGELEPFGEVADPRERAKLLDRGLAELVRYWAGDFEPVPLQRPRIPVWVASEWPYRRPVQRALQWDGLFPTGLPEPAALAELASEARAARPASEPFDLIVGVGPDDDPRPGSRPARPGSSPTLACSQRRPRSARSSTPARANGRSPFESLRCLQPVRWRAPNHRNQRQRRPGTVAGATPRGQRCCR
jgi:alkanesulfonate monooxygenase SsuD/methylene tetrahydromethanopterin reductase-like flavin-dependent oxidoreductase (luciferase family)